MYSSIVVGIDGSETADIALGRAVELARLTGATLHVVSAYDPAPTRVAGGTASSEFSVGSDFKADAALQHALDRAGGDKTFLAIAKEADAELIVIGSVGMHGARRVLGSVPNKVSHQASCDVLIVQTR